MENLLKIENTYDFVESSRVKIEDDFKKITCKDIKMEISKISSKDIALFFSLYDKYFFNGELGKCFSNKIKFSVSNKMTKSAGKTIVKRNNYSCEINQYEIRMGLNFFVGYNKVDRDKYVNGVKTKDVLNAFSLVFEHELCHLLEFYIFNKSSCSNKRFKTIAKKIFGHTGVFHELPTYSEIAYKNMGLKLGCSVNFNYEGNLLHGVINAINKRATVMVSNDKGNYLDRLGNHYLKYYVSLDMLEKSTKNEK